jgi:hypothetical protein
VDLPAVHGRTHHDAVSRESLAALEQIYGYMTFNNNKFGILTNWQRAWFLRRAETPGCKNLEYFLVELHEPSAQISMLKAWVGMVLLANDDWLYASPSTKASPPPARHCRQPTTNWQEWNAAFTAAGQYHTHPDPIDHQYPCLPLDVRLCHFDCSSARHGENAAVIAPCMVTAKLLNPSGSDLTVICKVGDVSRDPELGNELEDEAHAYAVLQNLQGHVIPTLYGFYEMWGMLKLLALEPVGDAIPEDENIDKKLRSKMKSALQHIHNAGWVHGDIARRNFCRTKSGDVFLVDLAMSRHTYVQAELDDEMKRVDKL